MGGSEKASQDLKRSGNWFIYCTRKVLTILGGEYEIVFEHASHSEWFKESEWYKFKNL